ncbi:hypothetical protein PRUPE_8G256800 [Prunus persica]|uniref:Uncharacterized protein n=1 Tax=Prunus persica TaxID=3760 RepID=A0A251N3E0_PRUPE|nr:hypothetical protein PRUPE_8G256800 [Prunus persica]
MAAIEDGAIRVSNSEPVNLPHPFFFLLLNHNPGPLTQTAILSPFTSSQPPIPKLVPPTPLLSVQPPQIVSHDASALTSYAFRDLPDELVLPQYASLGILSCPTKRKKK